MEEKLKAFCDKITKETQQRLRADNLGCEANMVNAISHSHKGKKYTRVDIGQSGKYMVDNITGEIFGIKAYGVINKKQPFGTLDTINGFYWGCYKAYKI